VLVRFFLSASNSGKGSSSMGLLEVGTEVVDLVGRGLLVVLVRFFLKASECEGAATVYKNFMRV
jgi:hypothetical protein